MIVLYILLAILMFSVLIFIHELGHFIAAKLSGVQVNEFSLFMGPALWKRQKGETLYALRLIPIGGYCAMEGEDGQSDNPRAFGKAKLWKRLIILAAGAAMNFVFGVLLAVLFTSLCYKDGLPAKTIMGQRDAAVASDFQAGDELYSIDGERIYILNDLFLMMDRTPKDTYDVVVVRDGKKVTLNDADLSLHTFQNKEGKDYRAYTFYITDAEPTVGSVLSYSWNLSVDFARLVRLGLQDLFRGKASIKDIGGPVMIVESVAETSAKAENVGMGLLNVLYFFSFIAINLAVMNLLPIPALDGGRIACMLLSALLEKILRRKINPKYEGYLHAAFLVLLLALMALVALKDVIHVFGG